MLCVIDYGSGNIAAIVNICERERIRHCIASEPAQLADATHYLLPGVGAFDPTIATLEKSGLLSALKEQVLDYSKPILGICVGMHLLAEGSDEGLHAGLGWISGQVTGIDPRKLTRPPRLPHMGWNSICGDPEDPLLQGIEMARGFYFLHSFFFDAHDPQDVVATVLYGDSLPCIVRRGHIVGAQFHPEKSHTNGIRFLKNFVGVR